MNFITSAAEAQVSARQNSAAGRTASTNGGSFTDTLKRGFTGIRENMDAIFQEAASRYDLPVKLLQAVAKAESNFNPSAVSHAGAIGVMQLMPGTARSLGVTDPYDARQNIMGGAKYLKENLDRFGDVSLALAAYNAGPNRVKQYGGIPPFKETQNYVKKVLGYMGESALNAGKTVLTGGSRGSYSSALSALNGGSGYGSLLAGLAGGSSAGALGSAYESLASASDGGDSEGVLGGGYGGLLSSLAGGSSSLTDGGMGLSVLNLLGGGGMMSLTSLTDQLSIRQEGDEVVMDKETFSSLIQLMRIQMMMNADREVGVIEL